MNQVQRKKIELKLYLKTKETTSLMPKKHRATCLSSRDLLQLQQ